VTSLIEERRFRRHHRSDPAPGCDSSSDADGTPRALTRWGQTTKDNVALCRLAAWAGSARSAACADPTSSPRTRVVTGHPSAVTGPSCCRLRSPPRPASWELCTRGTAGGGGRLCWCRWGTGEKRCRTRWMYRCSSVRRDHEMRSSRPAMGLMADLPPGRATSATIRPLWTVISPAPSLPDQPSRCTDAGTCGGRLAPAGVTRAGGGGAAYW